MAKRVLTHCGRSLSSSWRVGHWGDTWLVPAQGANMPYHVPGSLSMLPSSTTLRAGSNVTLQTDGNTEAQRVPYLPKAT